MHRTTRNNVFVKKMKSSEDENLIQFTNCSVLKDHQILTEDVWVRRGRILKAQDVFYGEKIKSNVKIDCCGQLVAPGFIDLQINGALGVDFSLPSATYEDDLKKVARSLLTNGVTAFCPTVVSSVKDTYAKVLPLLAPRKGSKEFGATILGAHLEGPFINGEKRGAHLLDNLSSPVCGFDSILERYGSLKEARIVTIAPELPNAMEVIRKLAAQDITVSLGHSMADLECGEEAVCMGASFITHLFNAMLPFHHRDPHLVGLLTSKKIVNRPIYYGLIADGVHTHPAAIRIAQRGHPEGLILVTDAIAAHGLETGVHHIGTQKIEIREQKAFIAGTETLCGSIASLNDCVRNLFKFTGCSDVQALEAASLHPAQLMCVSQPCFQKGRLNPGYDADLILLDQDLQVLGTYIAGKEVWRSNRFC